MNYSRYTYILLFLLIPLHLSGQQRTFKRLDGSTIKHEEVDALVNNLMNASGVEGVGLAVLNKGRTVFLKGYGYRNLPQKELLDTASIMYAASFSKAVTGYLAMCLMQEGLFSLDTPIYRYLKKPITEYEYFADLENAPDWKLITAKMCLSHTTGLPNVRWFHPVTSDEDTSGILRIYFAPGTKYAYSGEGFKLLQLMIEEVTGQKFDDLASTYIFNPAGMTRSGFVWHNSFGDSNVAVGHLTNGAIDKKKKRTEAVAGGSMVTTIADYARFIEFVLARKHLSKKWFDTMVTPHIQIHSVTQFPPITYETTHEYESIGLSYGLGWGILKCEQGKAIFKEGNGGAWRNYNINFIDKGFAVIIMVNSENGEKIFQKIIEGVAGPTCIPWKWNGYVSN